MKHLCKILLCGLLSTFLHPSGLMPARAQQKIDPTVEVRKAFEGNLMEIHKSRLAPRFDDSLTRFSLDFDYIVFDKPYKDLYEFTPLPSAQLQGPVAVKRPVFFARLGAGYPLIPQADLYFQPRMRGNHSLVLSGHHQSFFGKLPRMRVNEQTRKTEADAGPKTPADHMTNRVGADYGHTWQSGELSAGAWFSHNYYTYYGLAPDAGPLSALSDGKSLSRLMKNHLSHTYTQAGLRFNVQSVLQPHKGTSFHYRLGIDYLHTSDKPSIDLPALSGAGLAAVPSPASATPAAAAAEEGTLTTPLREHLFRITGEFGPTVGRYSRFTVGINSETAVQGGLLSRHYGIIEAGLHYRLQKDRWLLRAGVKFSAKYTDEHDAGQYHHPFFVQAEAAYTILPESLQIYGKTDGHNDIRSYASMLEQNKWIGPLALMRAGSVPLLIRGGFRGQLRGRFGYDVYAAYTIHKGLVQYVAYNSEAAERPVSRYGGITSVFDALYANHRQFTAGGEFTWQSRDFSGGAEFRYHAFTRGKKMTGNLTSLPQGCPPFGYAPIEGLLHGEYNWRQRIFAGARIHFRGAAPVYFHTTRTVSQGSVSSSPDLSGEALVSEPAADVKLRPFTDLSLRLKYVFNPRFAVYLQGSDLLNQSIAYFPLYLEKGISFEAGLFLKF